MASTTTLLTTLDVAKWFIVLSEYSDKFDPSFMKSVCEADAPTDKQLESLERVVETLKLREKIKKYNTDGYIAFFEDEIELDTDQESCFVTKQNLLDECVILDRLNQKFMSVEAFKQNNKVSKKVKVKKTLKDLLL